MSRLLCLVVFFLYSSGSYAHGVFSSFTRIDWNTSDNSIELVIEIQAHELEAKMSGLLDEQLTFLDVAHYSRLETATAGYIPKHIQLSVNQQPIQLEYLGMEIDRELVHIYMESTLKEAPKSITFMNSMLLDDLPGQTNSVLAAVNGKKKGADITKGSGPAIFTLN